MRVAIVHFWLVSMRAAKKSSRRFANCFQKPIFSPCYDPGLESETIRKHKIVTTFINSLPRARRYYKHYLPLMPLALEQIDLRGYDLIISSESGRPKGSYRRWRGAYLLLSLAHALRLEHVSRLPRARRLVSPSHDAAALSLFAHLDATASMRVDRFIANSATVAARIEKYYRRDAEVIHPPVNLELFESVPRARSKIIISWPANSSHTKGRSLPSRRLMRLAAV